MASLFPTLALADVPTAQVPASLQSAIKADVESRGQRYAGFCRVVNESPNLPFGQWCAFVLSIEHDIAEVTIGPVASDDITRVTFVNENGGWVKQGGGTPPTTPAPTQPTTPAPTQPTTPAQPPSKGSDVEDGGSNSEIIFAVLGGGIAVAAVAGVALAANRRR